MSKNKRNFITSVIGSGIIFIIGVLYILIPNYYGIDNLEEVNINNLFTSFILIYTTINLSLYYIIGKNPTKERIFISIASAFTGIVNLLLLKYIGSYLAIRISLAILTLLIALIKSFTAAYYKDKKDATYYIEYMLIATYSIIGIIMPITLVDNTIVEVVELGFYVVIISIVDTMSITFKTLLKAPRFLGKIKF